jgi:N-acetyl-gamma-glutamyl-phosphate reductase
MKVGVVGAPGYASAELVRLLAGHPELALHTVAGRSAAGQATGDVFPHLAGMAGLPEVVASPELDALDGCELVFLATPAESSAALAPTLSERGATVVDLSGAFRLDAATYAEWYGAEHPTPQLAPAPYGLPEWFRDDLAGAGLVAVPGCYATAAVLACAPLFASGLIEPASVAVAGLSGTSGAGRKLREDLHGTHAMGNAAAYGAPGHRHTPEIEGACAAVAGGAEPTPITFTPHLLPTARGLVCTATAALQAHASEQQVQEAFAKAYDPEPFVTVLGEGAWPATTHVCGGNAAHVGLAVDHRTGRVTASCALDNLVKGAAGQALQAANVALGLPEETALSPAGVYP